MPLFLGSDRTNCQTVVQVAGSAYRLSARSFVKALARSEALRRTLNRYTQALFSLVAQGSACNRMHTARERCARWLLHTHDRVGQDHFSLNQLFLAQMLGLRRASVSGVAGELKRARLIDYKRGVIRILDRGGLERAACECYAIIMREFDRLLDGAPRRGRGGRATSKNGESTLVPPRKRQA